MSRVELHGVIFEGLSVEAVVQAVVFGEPGVDIWLGDRVVQLTVEHCKALGALLRDQFEESPIPITNRWPGSARPGI